MKLKFAVASLLAVASMSAFAGNQTVAVLDNPAGGWFASFTSLASDDHKALSGVGGSDTINFTGLSSGLYNVFVDVTGQDLKWNGAASTINGQTTEFDVETNGKVKIKYTLSLDTVTNGMLLGGLGIMGFLARRKAKKA
jgi:hypothetical protein